MFTSSVPYSGRRILWIQLRLVNRAGLVEASTPTARTRPARCRWSRASPWSRPAAGLWRRARVSAPRRLLQPATALPADGACRGRTAPDRSGSRRSLPCRGPAWFDAAPALAAETFRRPSDFPRRSKDSPGDPDCGRTASDSRPHVDGEFGRANRLGKIAFQVDFFDLLVERVPVVGGRRLRETGGASAPAARIARIASLLRIGRLFASRARLASTAWRSRADVPGAFWTARNASL